MNYDLSRVLFYQMLNYRQVEHVAPHAKVDFSDSWSGSDHRWTPMGALYRFWIDATSFSYLNVGRTQNNDMFLKYIFHSHIYNKFCKLFLLF